MQTIRIILTFMITMLMAYNENHPFKGLNKVYMVDECWVR